MRACMITSWTNNAWPTAAAAGAGKTTLVNHILNEQRDLRICVIENEFGAVSVRANISFVSLIAVNPLHKLDYTFVV
jgi:ABC-type molybdenum transport system ATPase subunit/photorepair protein PhrA